jgi:large conductance mechanosensitive channel
MASSTMSVSSSSVEVVDGPGGVDGSAWAMPTEATESPISTAKADNEIRIATPSKLAPEHTTCSSDRASVAYLGFRHTARPHTGRKPHVLKGFKEFLARGNIVDLSVAVVIGTAFTALVTKFTESVVQPLIDRIGAGGGSDYGVLKIDIGGGQTIDLNVLLSAAINFVLVAAVVYFLVVVPYNRLRKKGEVEQAQDTELSLLTEIRNLMKDGTSDTVTGPGTGPSPDTAQVTSADK